MAGVKKMNRPNDGGVISLQIKSGKGLPMVSVSTVRCIQDQGLVGHYHQGGPRQVSLLAREAVEVLSPYEGAGLCLQKYAANVITEGLDYTALNSGQRLSLGDCELELTEVGKACHVECRLFRDRKACALTTLTAFARVIRSGAVQEGDRILSL